MKSYELAVIELYKGNREVFKIWLNGASKINMLNAIEFAMQEGLFKRHVIINIMRNFL